MGLFSGTIATVLTQRYLDRYVRSLEQSSWWEQQLSQEKPSPTPGSYDEALALSTEKLLPALVLFYNGAITSTLLPGSEVGAGVVITSDGWVLTNERAIGSRAFVGGVEYAITDIVRDSLTDVALIKLNGSGLPVIAFGNSEDLISGTQVFIGSGPGLVLATTITNPSAWRFSGMTAAAEAFSGFLTFGETLGLAGAPVVNTNGELVAIGDVPLHMIELSATLAVRTGAFSRASFGAQVIDLSFVHLSESLSRGLTHGAFVSSVGFLGPAQKAALRAGDIVLRLQDQTLTKEMTLAEILATFESGKRVSVLIDRGGEQQTVEVELGEL